MNNAPKNYDEAKARQLEALNNAFYEACWAETQDKGNTNCNCVADSLIQDLAKNVTQKNKTPLKDEKLQEKMLQAAKKKCGKIPDLVEKTLSSIAHIELK